MAKKQALATASHHRQPYLSATDIDALGPADRIARQIVTERRDLSPSVARIMDAELDGAVTLRAIELFRDSLQTMGDPNRDPRVAIAAALQTPASP